MLAETTRALLESLLCYELATVGEHGAAQELNKINSGILNRAARMVVGTNKSMGIETMMMLAEIRNSHNHFILINANIFDRVLRSTGTRAK